MNLIQELTETSTPTCIGSQRFSAEHWIHSHPSVKPCDLYTDPKFQYGYRHLDISSGLKEGDFEFQLAPRFGLTEKVGCMGKFGQQFQHRLAEYKFLYNQLPDESWWGWKLWHKEFEKLYNSTIPSLKNRHIKLRHSHS
jgi:hypothetical protein